jgi:two-component system chemotaxis response regulator CheY
MSLNLSVPVLVVDDHPTMVSIVSDVLRQIGFENIDGARNGSAALKKLNCKNYGLVISDDKMSPMSGGDLLRQMRANPRLAATPFVLLTADETRAETDVPCATIAKPFNAQMLHRRIETVLTA